jgi:hypothetical protein
MKLRWKRSTTLSVESGLLAWSETLPRSALLADGNDPAMEWLDHYLQCFLTGHALRRNVPMQIGKTRFRPLQSGDPETCLSDLNRPEIEIGDAPAVQVQRHLSMRDLSVP